MIVEARIVGANIDQADYLTHEGTKGQPDYVMSRSDLTEFAKGPHKWRFGPEDEDDETTKALRWGSLLDVILTGSEEDFKSRFVVRPETYKSDKGEEKPWNNNATVCKSWNDEHADCIVVKSREVLDAQEAVKAIKSSKDVRDLLDHAEMQVEIRATWRTEDGSAPDVPMKALIDILPARTGRYGSAMADLKTAGNASLDGWPKVVYGFGYNVQAALYLDMHAYATGLKDRRTNFLHVVSESVAPWEIGQRLLSLDFIQAGRAIYHNALERYARCVADDVWPGYDEAGEIVEGFAKVEPAPWMVMSTPSVRTLDAPGEMP